MTRRSAYLSTWGITFLAIGMFFFSVGVPAEWSWLFLGSGSLSLLGALSRPRFMDTLAFMALTVTSALRAFWYAWDYLQTQFAGDIFGIILWLCVGISQVIIAGWPEATIQIKVDLDKVSNGVD